MEVKNKREDLFTQNLPPKVKSLTKTLLLSSDYWKDTAGSKRSKEYDLAEYDYIMVSASDTSHEYAIGILPADFITDKTVVHNLQFELAGSTYLTISYYKNDYWEYHVNQIYNKTVNVYGIKV
mgnify:CR=1 FL=1